MDRLGPRQGHLDHAAVGETREAPRCGLGGHVHRRQSCRAWTRSPPGRSSWCGTGSTSRSFPLPPPRAEGEPPVLTILSVGRAVEKKGYPDLIAALARLPGRARVAIRPRGRRGPQIATLRQLAERAGVAGRTEVGGCARAPRASRPASRRGRLRAREPRRAGRRPGRSSERPPRSPEPGASLRRDAGPPRSRSSSRTG